MKQNTIKPEIQGTRAGQGIRFTCPACTTENIIISKMPKDHFRESHDATCKHCRLRSTVLTPYAQNKMDYYPVSAYCKRTTVQ